MHSLPSEAASVDANDIELPFECPTNEELENRVVSPCGRFESFDYKGGHFEIDWNELVGDDDEEEMPHEEFMAELDLYIEELEAQRGGVIRAVKHAASENPFLGVREAGGRPPTMLTTRDPATEPFLTA